jgi:hypothetical protein
LGVLGLGVSALTLGVAAFQWRRARRAGRARTWYALAVATTVVGAFTILANLTATIGGALQWAQVGLAAGISGWPAYWAWLAAEGVNAYEQGTRRPKTGPSNLSLFKSVCQMLGALFLWLFALLTLWNEAGKIGALFWGGAGLAGLGTLLGIAAGLWNLRRK